MTIIRDDEDQFMSLNIALLTVSDTRTAETDTSGDILAEAVEEDGHGVVDRLIIPDDIYQIRAALSCWIAEEDVDAVILIGGTGLTGRDRTPEAIRPLLDKEIEGFGELFRMISFQEIKTSALQSRALSGVANGTLIFAIPGSTNACRTAWHSLIRDQLDSNHRPCNLAALIPRLKEC